MMQVEEYRRILLRLERTVAPRSRHFLPIRESLGSFMLGSLSVSVGIAVVIAVIAGIAGRPFPGWSPWTGAVSSIVGECLGLAGILASQIRNRSISLISALGTTISLVHMYIFLVHAWLF